jgi:hypothetical protein
VQNFGGEAKKLAIGASFGNLAPVHRGRCTFGALVSLETELGWNTVCPTPIVSSLDLDLYSFFLKLTTGPAVASGGTMYHRSVCVKSPRDINKSITKRENPHTENILLGARAGGFLKRHDPVVSSLMRHLVHPPSQPKAAQASCRSPAQARQTRELRRQARAAFVVPNADPCAGSKPGNSAEGR